MRRILWTAVLVFIGIMTQAQDQDGDKGGSLSVTGDFANRFIWRGLALSASPCIQPSIDFTKGNFSAGSWNSYTFAKEGLQETDLYLSYSIGNFTFTLNDYYMPSEDTAVSKDYFNYSRSKTSHSFEVYGEFNGPDNFPVKLAAGTILYGDDRKKSGGNTYSTYCEAGFTFTCRDVTLYPYIGFTPAGGWYHTRAGVVNTGITLSKEIKITDSYSIPLSTSFIANPAAGKVYVLFTASLF